MEIINPWHLYLWTRLDSLCDVLQGSLVVLSISLIIILFLVTVGTFGDSNDWFTKEEDGSPRYQADFAGWLKFKKVLGWWFFLFIITISLKIAIPSKKDMAIIYILSKIANNEVIQTEAREIYQIAKDALIETLPKKEKVEE